MYCIKSHIHFQVSPSTSEIFDKNLKIGRFYPGLPYWMFKIQVIKIPAWYLSCSRKFKRGIRSLFDPVLTLWGGGHIGSSRMEQSYCTSRFFRQRVTASNHSNYQPRPKRRSIIAHGKGENALRNKVCRSVYYVFSCFTLSKLSRERHSYFPVFIFFKIISMVCKCCD